MTLIDLPFTSPLLNAAGTLGYSPDTRRFDPGRMGGFITNPVSYSARSPASGTRMVPFSGGLLLHTGYANPGFQKIIRDNRQRWQRSELPIAVHLLAEDEDELFRMVRVLEETEGVQALEIGLPPGAAETFARAALQAAVGELPVIARIGLEDVDRLLGEAVDAGASAVSMGPPRGSLPGPDGRVVSGRLAGAAIFSQALEILRRVQSSGIAIIFSGGIQNRRQVTLALECGAAAVQLDTALWRFGTALLP